MTGKASDDHALRQRLMDKMTTKKEEKVNAEKTGKTKLSSSAHWGDRRLAWSALEATADEDKVFFDKVKIASDGGLSEVGYKPELWYGSRYFSTLLLLVFVVYNVYYIIVADKKILQGEGRMPEGQGYYLVSTLVLDKIGCSLPEELASAPMKIVAIVELLLLGWLLLRVVQSMIVICGTVAYRRWLAASFMCWDLLPTISSFSAIKLLYYVVPQALNYDLGYILWYDWSATKLLWFFISRPLALIIGLDCFLIKYRTAHENIMTSDGSLSNIIASIVLLNQVLGVVQLTKTINSRLYRFVFGGEDGIMTHREKVRKDTWQAMVAQKIWHRYPLQKAVALLLTWCDDDFQMLVLNDADDDDE
eukprot:CAMPEP_0170609226 /NCGR_PEP_ID=MMETSP0224-20130122/22008_1 /TAXON_ID=285029 /ORGANISM="Togula jolla, Strain CCCM 725" /LENGTH=361 /DNA_ID=CAMNT_0010934511 /DNA_START=94 /DNA_END=1179 /DNA_ORIENTATION=-